MHRDLILMIINLTKLLDVYDYCGTYGETSWIGILPEGINNEKAYSFELEQRIEQSTRSDGWLENVKN